MKNNKLLIVANWKNNPRTLVQAKELFRFFVQLSQKNKRTQIVVCPPLSFLGDLKKRAKLKLGGQNCSADENRPLTGEIAAQTLKNLGCEYVILGHSERRKFFKENNVLINQKIKSVLKQDFKILFCVGEEKKRDSFTKVQKQIREGLKGVKKPDLKQIYIVYEPLFAISTQGAEAVPPKLVLQKMRQIENFCQQKWSWRPKIIYGGSVDDKNIESFLKLGISGFLVGRASLNVKNFSRMLETCERN